MTTEERMEKMEAQLARTRRLVHCLMACIVLALGAWLILKNFGPETALARSRGEVLTANSFVLEDENGNKRAVLGYLKGEGTALSLLDDDGMTRVTLSMSGNEQGALTFFDKDGEHRAVLQEDKEDGPSLGLWDEDGKRRATLGFYMKMPSLMMRDESQRGGALLTVLRDKSSLSLRDKDGKVTWSTP
jgi:hypothetical protein